MTGMLSQIEATVKARVAKRDADRRAREEVEAQAQRDREEREKERRRQQVPTSYLRLIPLSPLTQLSTIEPPLSTISTTIPLYMYPPMSPMPFSF